MKTTQTNVTRRNFLKASGTLLAASAFACPAFGRERSPNSKLNMACVGVANRAAASVEGVSGENIIAMCDVFSPYLEARKQQFKDAKFYSDFRVMYDEMGDKIDAVTVGTPDHLHAVASVMAMKRGIHVYCEKPLCHDVYEVKCVLDIAREKKIITQMGTQIHAEPNYRRVVELVQAGAIGKVEEVNVWCGKGWGGDKLPKDKPPVPAGLDWNLWLGPVTERPYHPCYVPGGWRKWWAFGNGTLGDMACHLMDLPFWALGLSYPKTIAASSKEAPDPDGAPASLEVRYTFPRDGEKDLVLTWNDGDTRPAILKEKGLPDWVMGVLFVGTDGILLADYGQIMLYPEEKFREYKRPEPSIPNSIGHYEEWIKAIKDGKPEAPLCRFDYSGPLTTSVLLGCVSFRSGKTLEWNAKEHTVTNAPEAAKFLKQERRDGWSLE